jgi:excisionase family DNA binding protein
LAERLWKVEEAAREILHIGRTSLYELLARGEIESVVILGRSRRIPDSALQAFIDRLKVEHALDGPQGLP